MVETSTSEQLMIVKWWMRPLAVFIGLVVAFSIAEAATRISFALGIGPRVLLYGTDWYRNSDPGSKQNSKRLSDAERKHTELEWTRKDSVENHVRTLDGYTKFFPNEYKTTHDADTGERIPVSINSLGFRGSDFRKEKAQKVVRVLTMGASSTFGYYNKDNETYPYLLERALNQGCGGKVNFEVINFAIPHATSAMAAAMFVAEGIDLSPDIVTYYEGRNDSMIRRQYETRFDKFRSVLVHRLLLIAFIDQILVGERVSIVEDSLQLEVLATERSRVFLKNMETILNSSRKAGISFIVANQQATSRSPVPTAVQERLLLRGVSLEAEAEKIRRKINDKGNVTDFEFTLLIHERMMRDLRQWADRQGVPFVDVIGALNQDRHYLLSWVHLHPEANRVVAAKLSEPILRQFCASAGQVKRAAR